MWVKKLDVEELGIEFMPRSMDPLDKKQNKYDNMVEDEEEFEEKPVGIEFDLGLQEAEILMKSRQQ
jgi:hypothetical protein